MSRFACIQGLVASIIEYKPADPWSFVLSIVTETCPKLAEDPQAVISKLIEAALPETFETALLGSAKTSGAVETTDSDGKENVDMSNDVSNKDVFVSDEAITAC